MAGCFSSAATMSALPVSTARVRGVCWVTPPRPPRQLGSTTAPSPSAARQAVTRSRLPCSTATLLYTVQDRLGREGGTHLSLDSGVNMAFSMVLSRLVWRWCGGVRSHYYQVRNQWS